MTTQAGGGSRWIVGSERRLERRGLNKHRTNAKSPPKKQASKQRESILLVFADFIFRFASLQADSFVTSQRGPLMSDF